MNYWSPGWSRGLVAAATATACALGVVLLPQASASPSKAPSSASSVSTVAARAAAPGTIDSQIRGTFGRAGTVRGTFKPIRSFVRGVDPVVYGVMRATLRRGNGAVVGTVTRNVALPVRNATNPAGRAPAAQRATCDILHLVLGPLDLDLLGLQVHLNRVVLDIVAVTGAGNLLGNLLCAVTGLLDRTGLLNQLRLANALNRILSILRVV